MKNLLTALVVTVSLFAFAGCASQSKATGPNGACCNMCPVSNEALPADCKVAGNRQATSRSGFLSDCNQNIAVRR